MRQTHGFTLVEVLIFIVVSSLLMNVILLSANTALQDSPSVRQQSLALATAEGCMEWLLDQRRLNGYASLSCPSTPATSACPLPSGYAISAAVACSTWNADTAFKTITVSVTGPASVSLSTLIGNS